MKTFLLLVCLISLLMPVSIDAQGNTGTLQALSHGDATTLAWNIQGELLAVGTFTGLVIHDSDFNIVTTFDNYTYGTDFAWSADGDLFFVATSDSGYQIVQWDSAGETVSIYETDHRIENLVINASSTKLAGAENGIVRIWSLATDEITSVPSPEQDIIYAVSALAWHPIEDWLAIARAQVYIWDAFTGEMSTVSELPAEIGLMSGLSWHPAGEILAIGSPADIYLWDMRISEISVLTDHTSFVRHLGWVGTGEILASGSDDGTLVLWETASQQALVQFYQPTGVIDGLSVNPATQDVYVLDEANEIKAFNPFTQETGAEYFGYAFPSAPSWTADGTAVADGHLQWNLASGEVNLISVYNPPLVWSPAASSVAWNHAGTRVAHTNEYSDLATVTENYQTVYELDEASDYFAWSPDDQWLATYPVEATAVKIWSQDEVVVTLDVCPQVECVVAGLNWHPDSLQVAIVARYNRMSVVRVYDVTTGTHIMESTEITGNSQVAWSVDASQLVVDSEERGLIILDSTTGTEVAGYSNLAISVLSPDRSRLVTVDVARANPIVQVYDVASMELLAELDLEVRGTLNAFAWSPNGQSIAFVADGVLYAWQPE